MSDKGSVYLAAFVEFEQAQTIYQDARRNYRADRDLYERALQDYLLKATRVARIAQRLGIKPIGGFAAQLPVPLGVRP